MLSLYTYFRSSAAYRVRIALNLKKLSYQSIGVHLLHQGGQQHSTDYILKNPMHLVPTLEHDDFNLTQSLAIIEYLDDVYPEHPLLPSDPRERAYVRSLALAVACDIHPLNNLRILQYLERDIGLTIEQKTSWIQHWITLGLTGVERLLEQSPQQGLYCLGDRPSMADCVLIPQLFNAHRFACDLSAYPRITAIEQHCNQLEAFIQALPANQADAE